MAAQAQMAPEAPAGGARIILAGPPNVGKSVLFGRLTGHYVTVANYPGTTVDVAQATLQRDGRAVVVLDAPGINSLQPAGEDERVTRRLLLAAGEKTVVQVADAKNLARALTLTLQLGELGLPLVLVLNMADEAVRRGVTIDRAGLEARLGVEVVTTVATRGQGMAALQAGLSRPRVPTAPCHYGSALEAAVAAVTGLLPPERAGRRGLAVLLLAGDPELEAALLTDAAARAAFARIREEAAAAVEGPLNEAIGQRRRRAVQALMAAVYGRGVAAPPAWSERLGAWAVHPLAGWPVLAAVLAVFYLVVGQFGAGTLVTWLQTDLFGGVLVPALGRLLDTWLPVPWLHDLLIGDYGLVTMGLAYGLGIVLPIVSTFFLVFGVLEDSGYLPRLAVMVNRGFRVIGLNGRAVLPMVLGLGCVTMATMTTRILATRKERLLATLLLALSVPCSAQLGVILAMAGSLPVGMVAVWAGVVLGVLLAVGALGARLIPGAPTDFILELPPLRVPQLGNLVVKTLARVEWYLKEVIPLFLGAALALFVLARLGILGWLEQALQPLVVGWLGLPPQTAGILLLGFLRRDFGAAGFYNLARAGALTPHQVLVSLVVVTLFVPCIATVLMMIKEQGRARALTIVAIVCTLALLIGGLVDRLVGG